MFRKRLTGGKIFFVAGALAAVLFLFWISVPEALAFQEMDLAPMSDTAKWKTYQNDIYKFEIKYPSLWTDPQEEDISDPDFGFALKIYFSSDNTFGNISNGGFLVFISKNEDCAPNSACASHELHRLRETPSNYLYEASGQVYNYTLAPVIPEDEFLIISKENVLSQFSAAMETFSFDPSFRPAARKTSQSVKSSPKRAAAFIGKVSEVLAKTRLISGKKVCAKKNDHPAPSKIHPKWQVDGECCLDPYEIPNASCYCPPEKYGNLIQKYLASQNK